MGETPNNRRKDKKAGPPDLKISSGGVGRSARPKRSSSRGSSGVEDIPPSSPTSIRRYSPLPGSIKARLPNLKGKYSPAKPLSENAKREVSRFVTQIIVRGVDGLREDFQQLQSISPPGTFVESGKNGAKNRSAEIGCNDQTRTVLTFNVPPDSSYIHANWVKMAHNTRTFIATQAPLVSTVDDFWRLCLQESVVSILMLCTTAEEGGPGGKCPQYWPPDAGSTRAYGRVCVTNRKYIVEECFRRYYLILSLNDNSSAVSPVQISLFLMLGWTHKGVPSHGVSVTLLTLLQYLEKSGNCVTMCIDGVGRSGVAIAVDTITRRLLKGVSVEVVEVIKELRSMRAKSITNLSQFFFLLMCVLEYIKAQVPEHRKVVVPFLEKIEAANVLKESD